MSVTIKRLLLFFMIIACCIQTHTQLPCCQVQPAPGSPFVLPDGSVPQIVAFSPTTNCLAVAALGSNTVLFFTVDPDTCSLMPTGESDPFDTVITALAFSPVSNCLAVVNDRDAENPGTVSLFTFDPNTCILNPTAVDTETVGLSPSAVAFSSNNCLAVLDNIFGVFMFTVGDPNPCSLTPVMGNPFNVVNPISIAFSSDGNCLAVTSSGSPTNFISLFPVNSDCSLSTANSIPIPISGIHPLSIAFSTNNCLAIVDFDNTVSLFTVDPDTCSLMPSGEPVPVGTIPNSVAFSSNGNCLAVANNGDAENPGTVSLFIVSNSCTLTQIQGSPLGFPAGSNPNSVSFSPNNCLAVASPNTNTISVFSPFTLQQPSIDSAVVTDCPTIRVTGTAGPSVTIDIFADDDPTAVASGPTNTQGIFDFEITSLSPGAHSITAVTTALDCSVASEPFMVTIALQQPMIDNAEVTSCPFIRVTGTADPNVTIDIFTDNDLNNPIGTGSTNTQGNFEIITTASLSLGTHSITAVASTPGCTSALSSSVDITVSLPEPIIMNATVTNCNTVTVTGTTGSNATVTLFVDDNPNVSGSTDEDGNFSISTTPLPASTHSITAVATVSDCTSAPSAPITVTISTPTITSVSFGCGNIITVMGTSAPNTSVTLLADTLTVATIMTNSEGAFMIVGAILPENTRCITVLDNSSGCSSAPICLTASPTACVIHVPNLAFGTHCNQL